MHPRRGEEGENARVLNEAEERALLELLAACTTVFEEDPFTSPNAANMSLRRIQKPTLKAIAVFSSAPTIGAGRAQNRRSEHLQAEHEPGLP